MRSVALELNFEEVLSVGPSCLRDAGSSEIR